MHTILILRSIVVLRGSSISAQAPEPWFKQTKNKQTNQENLQCAEYNQQLAFDGYFGLFIVGNAHYLDPRMHCCLWAMIIYPKYYKYSDIYYSLYMSSLLLCKKNDILEAKLTVFSRLSNSTFYRSDNFRMTFGCLHLNQKTNKNMSVFLPQPLK